MSQHYATTHPGQVQVLGVDLWNGSAGQLAGFQAVTGATFPLLLNGMSAAGGNLQSLYGTYDNYIVINKQGIVRYHAALSYAQGNRYHLNEIRGAVDSLVTNTADAGPPIGSTVALSAAPNPVRESARITLVLPAAERAVDVSVFDASGRRVGTLWSGAAAAGVTSLRWDARDESGARVAPGVYLIRAEAGARSVTRRLAVVR